VRELSQLKNKNTQLKGEKLNTLPKVAAATAVVIVQMISTIIMTTLMRQ